MDHGGIHRLLMEEHVGVVAAAVVADHAQTASRVGTEGAADIEPDDALLEGIELAIDGSREVRQ